MTDDVPDTRFNFINLNTSGIRTSVFKSTRQGGGKLSDVFISADDVENTEDTAHFLV